MSRSLSVLVAFVTVLSLKLVAHSDDNSVVVFSLDGHRTRGQLTSCVDSKLLLQTESGPVELTFDSLDRLETSFASDAPSQRLTKGKQTVTLVDGSQIQCEAFQGRDDRWTAKSNSGLTLDLPKGSVESLLFISPSDELKSEWTNAKSETRSFDEMVISRSDRDVDRASGMIVAVSPDVVEFSFDGQILQAPRAKLLGLLWYRSQAKRAAPVIQVAIRDGSRWEAASLELTDRKASNEVTKGNENGLAWTTPCGVTAMAVWKDIREVNFSSANVVWLASQTALATKTFQRTFTGSAIPGRDTLLGPRFDSADGSSDAKSQDLHFTGPGEITFRVPSGFRRFVSKIRRFEKARFMSAIQCEIWLGDELAWNVSLPPDQMEATVDIPVASDKQMRIVVTCESDLMLGTQISWQQPRLTR
ncbi:MAG: hypothetical protein SGI77_13135 [Pirellulaceae bacterium]|nr:hypothetical protein [Pirellulaceae bacterium]